MVKVGGGLSNVVGDLQIKKLGGPSPIVKLGVDRPLE